jgi:nucleoside-diphosphate-sugar epimerase
MRIFGQCFMIVLFGSSGQIGSALYGRLRGSAQLGEPVCLTTAEIAGDVVGTLKKRSLADRDCDYIFGNGLTNPALGIDALVAANIDFVRHVIDATFAHSSSRYLTFGTIHEDFPDLCRANPYFETKRELSLLVSRMGAPERFRHLRLHTVYGGTPKEHMFLGQMVQALRTNTVFKMSSGEQLREYHHADDIAGAAQTLLSRAWIGDPLMELSSGRPVRLATLAQAVFAAFGKEHLLEIGAIHRHAQENVLRTFERSPEWILGESRDAVEGVIAYVRKCLESEATASADSRLC